MTDSVLAELKDLVRQVVRLSKGPVEPGLLLATVNVIRPPEATVEDCRLALWDMIADGDVVQTTDRRIRLPKETQ